MPHSDDHDEVEFVDHVGAPVGDEELPQPPRRALPGSVAQRRSLITAAVVLAGLALGARALGGHNHKAAAAAPTATPSSSASPRGLSATWEVQPPATITSVVVVPINGKNGLVYAPAHSLVTPTDVPTCPTADLVITCTMSHTAGAQFLAAVVRTLPGARPTSFTSVVTHGSGGTAQLEFCRLAARAGELRILVQVQRPRVANNGIAYLSDDGRRSTVYTTNRVAGYTVQVELSGPSGHTPSPDRVDQLASDPRVLTPS